jgi:prenyltransferase beta subunit
MSETEPETHSCREQRRVEDLVMWKLERAPENIKCAAVGDCESQHHCFGSLKLTKKKHSAFCMRALNELSSSYQSLDAAQPWLAYWNLQALDVLETLEADFSPTATNKELLESRYEM